MAPTSDVPAREGQPRVLLQGVPGEGDLRAREGATQLQGVRGREHLRAREAAKQMQGVRGRARSHIPSQLSSNPAPLAMAYLTFSLIVARLL